MADPNRPPQRRIVRPAGQMSRDESSEKIAGGLSITPAGSNKFIEVVGATQKDWEAFMNEIDRNAAQLVGAAPAVQNEAAEYIADAYRNFLREGIEPENSELTQILYGVHPPLSGLADHIIVIPCPVPENVNYRDGGSATQFRGAGGRWASPKTPAFVTFESKWLNIAYMHDRGYNINPSPKLRQALFAQASAVAGNLKAFLSEDMGSHGRWMVPARPHIFFLNSPQMDEIMRDVANSYYSDNKPVIKTARPPSTKWIPLKARQKAYMDTINL